jgi:hypothetical protein
MTTISLSGERVTQLVDLLTVVAAAADTSDEDRYRFPSQCAALQGGGEGTPRRQAWC